MRQRWNYRHANESGTELLVHARCYDSSGPLMIGPDIHIMRVELKGPGVALSQRSFAVRLTQLMNCFRIDESGYTGFDLINPDQPFQGAAAIAIEVDEARRLIN